MKILSRPPAVPAALADSGGRFGSPELLWEYIRKNDEAASLTILTAGGRWVGPGTGRCEYFELLTDAGTP